MFEIWNPKSYLKNGNLREFRCSICLTFREMENVNGHVKFHNNYNQMNVQMSGNCKPWRSDVTCIDGGWLSANVFVDTTEEKWHANLKVDNLYVPVYSNLQFQSFVNFLFRHISCMDA
jgi:hypothetical protein